MIFLSCQNVGRNVRVDRTGFAPTKVTFWVVKQEGGRGSRLSFRVLRSWLWRLAEQFVILIGSKRCPSRFFAIEYGFYHVTPAVSRSKISVKYGKCCIGLQRAVYSLLTRFPSSSARLSLPPPVPNTVNVTHVIFSCTVYTCPRGGRIPTRPLAHA